MFILFIILFVILFLFLFKVSIDLTLRALGKSLNEQLRYAELIIETKKVPPDWRKEVNKHIMKGGKRNISREEISQAERKAKEVILVRLDKLQKSFEKSSFFEDSETRELFLNQLQAVRSDWQEKEWNELNS